MPVGRAGRDRPRPREPRVRVRHPAALKGGVQRAGELGRRRLPDPPAAGCRGGHHAVQLPGHGPDVDVRHGDRDRQHVPPQAVREGPVGVAVPRGAPARGGRARRRVQRRPGRQGRRRPDPRAPGDRGRLVRRLDPHRPLHLRDRHEARQARAGARRREEPHGGPAGRGRGHGRRCRHLRGLRQRRRAVHGDRDGGRRG